MNPRKRQASDAVLPLYASKRPRTHKTDYRGENQSPSHIEGIGARWSNLASEMWTLCFDTIAEFIGVAKRNEHLGRRPSPSTSNHVRPPEPSPSHIPCPPSKPQTPQSRQDAPPASAQSTPTASGSSQRGPQTEAGSPLASLTSAQTATLSATSSKTALNSRSEIEAAVAEASRRKRTNSRRYHSRPHIHEKKHKAQVRESRKRDMDIMERELYELKRSSGYNADYDTFREYVDYGASLSRMELSQVLSPSPSLRDLRAKGTPDRSRRHSSPDDGSLVFLLRSIEKARRTQQEPKPPPPFIPSLEQLRISNRTKDESIELRLHGPTPLPTSLPPEDEAEVTALLAKKGVIAKCEREQVTDRDLSRLRPHQWLNDEVINFYGQMITMRADGCKENPSLNGVRGGRSKPLNVHYFSTFFWTKLKGDGYEKGRLAKWTKKIDIFKKDVLLIPVNHNNTHWTAAAINFRKKRIESYDSMGMERRDVFKHLRLYLDAEHRNKMKQPFDFTGWKDYTLLDTPQQENGYDCGVFTCQFLESLSRGEEVFPFKQTDMPYLRRRMMWEIGHVQLRDDP